MIELMLVPRFVLASSSPRRAELLRAAGLDFEVIPSDADETRLLDERPDLYVVRVAEAKAAAVQRRAAGRTVLSADTVVVVDRLVLGKPTDADDARRMLQLLSGRTHTVVTGLCLQGTSRRTAVESTTVEFETLSPEEITWYVGSGEPADKAGAYAIQGLGSRFVRRIEGSYSNVVGLPVARTYQMLVESAEPD